MQNAELNDALGKIPVNNFADFNGNGRIDTGDATLILKKVVGLD